MANNIFLDEKHYKDNYSCKIIHTFIDFCLLLNNKSLNKKP